MVPASCSPFTPEHRLGDEEALKELVVLYCSWYNSYRKQEQSNRESDKEMSILFCWFSLCYTVTDWEKPSPRSLKLTIHGLKFGQSNRGCLGFYPCMGQADRTLVDFFTGSYCRRLAAIFVSCRPERLHTTPPPPLAEDNSAAKRIPASALTDWWDNFVIWFPFTSSGKERKSSHIRAAALRPFSHVWSGIVKPTAGVGNLEPSNWVKLHFPWGSARLPVTILPEAWWDW